MVRIVRDVKVEKIIKNRESKKQQEIEKTRRQKLKRSKKVKEKILRDKRFQSIKNSTEANNLNECKNRLFDIRTHKCIHIRKRH